jgi:hypothetical protein
MSRSSQPTTITPSPDGGHGRALRPLTANGTPVKNWRDYSGKPAKVMAAEAAAVRDAQPILTSCAYCDWTHDGIAAEGRLAALEHRKLKHPEAVGRKVVRRSPIKYRARVKPDDDLIAEQNRIRAEREEAVQLATIARGRARVIAESQEAA